MTAGKNGLFYYDLINNMFGSSMLMMHVISGNTVLASFEPTVVLEHEAVVGESRILTAVIEKPILRDISLIDETTDVCVQTARHSCEVGLPKV